MISSARIKTLIHVRSPKALNGIRRQKNLQWKACAEFYCRQIAEKVLSKIPAMHY